MVEDGFTKEEMAAFKHQHDEFKYISDVRDDLAQLTSRAPQSRLRSKAGAESKFVTDKFETMISEFSWRQVPVGKTQTALAELILVADDAKWLEVYREFLEAPIESAEDQAVASDALCRAHGICTTSYRPRKDWELVRAAPFVVRQADHCWTDEPEKVYRLASSLQHKDDNYSEIGRRNAMDLVATEPTGRLSELLTQYYELYDMVEERVEAERAKGKTYPWS
ncbi:hypothetical protein LX32DRAFT_653486 [Colletotrichum zoysiae]|uniref:Uncharacterized protein n=1 Tax=Colletotrichum zoysiae TaxID=1216348 RepID=A0AAD9HH84_9PEZI|nr:hypothetical protein LX32DRAFT_653486 [Colletotrichum zoysiae]